MGKFGSLESRMQRTAIDIWQTIAEHDPKATQALRWNLTLTGNKRERQTLAKAQRTHQKEVYRLRLRVMEPRIFEGTYISLQCRQAPPNQVIHYLTGLPDTHRLRERLLLSHVHPQDRLQDSEDLAISILNRQADRQ